MPSAGWRAWPSATRRRAWWSGRSSPLALSRARRWPAHGPSRRRLLWLAVAPDSGPGARPAAVDAARPRGAGRDAPARAAADGGALSQSRRGQRGGHEALPRVLHGRLRLARRAHRRTRAFSDAAAQPLHGARGAALLLDLLPRAGGRVLGGPARGARRRSRPEGQRDRDGRGARSRRSSCSPGPPAAARLPLPWRWCSWCSPPAPKARSRSRTSCRAARRCRSCATSTSTRSPRGSTAGSASTACTARCSTRRSTACRARWGCWRWCPWRCRAHPAGSDRSRASGLLLGLSTTVNPFLGAAFSLIYGLAILAEAVRTRASVAQVLRHAVAAAPPALAVLWGTLNAMGEGAGDALTIAWAGHARHAPVVTLLMSLGPVLVPALGGLVPTRRLPTPPVTVAVSGLLVGLWLLYFVVLSDASWVGFRAGQILLALITIPLARLLATIGAWSTTPLRRGAGRGAGRRHPRHRGADCRRRYLQRIGHREPGSGPRVSVDADGDARPAGRARLGETAHAVEEPSCRWTPWRAAGATGASSRPSRAGAWPQDCPSRCCHVRSTSGCHSRCARSSTAAMRTAPI